MLCTEYSKDSISISYWYHFIHLKKQYWVPNLIFFFWFLPSHPPFLITINCSLLNNFWHLPFPGPSVWCREGRGHGEIVQERGRVKKDGLNVQLFGSGLSVLEARIFFFLTSYWSIIALQWCVSFCFTTKWIIYTYTYVPISPPSCISLPPSLSHPSRWSQSTKLISLCYVAASH